MRITKIILTIILIFIFLFLLGCPESNNETIVRHFEVKKDIENASKNIDKSIKQIGTSVSIISEEAIKIKSISNNNDIKNRSDIILNETEELYSVKNNLSEASGKLKIAETKITQITDNSKILEKERDKAIKERNKLREDIKSNITAMLKWIIGASIVGVGIFGALAVFGNIKGGTFGIVTCITTMVLAITVGKYIALIAALGIGVIIFGIGVVMYQIYIGRKALKETIETTEETKKYINKEDKEKIFGDKGIANLLQSKNTIKLIKKERKKERKKEK